MQQRFLLASLLSAASVLAGCQSSAPDVETVAPRTSSTANLRGISARDGRLVFADRAAWDSTLVRLGRSDAAADALEQTYAYSSLRAATPAATELPEEYDDDVIRTLLNAQGVVQIGARVFRVDPANGAVYVVGNEADARLLTADPAAASVQRFGVEEDVLEALEADDARGIFCNDRRAGRQKLREPYCYSLRSIAHGARVRLVYQKWGIYFSLLARAKAEEFVRGSDGGCSWYVAGGGSATCNLVYLDWQARFKPRCQGEDKKSGRQTQRLRACIRCVRCTGDIVVRAYQASRDLAKYELTARFTDYTANFVAPAPLRIADGY